MQHIQKSDSVMLHSYKRQVMVNSTASSVLKLQRCTRRLRKTLATGSIHNKSSIALISSVMLVTLSQSRYTP
jgi:hypothetical protein